MFNKLILLLLLSSGALAQQDEIRSQPGPLTIEDTIALQGQQLPHLAPVFQHWINAVSLRDSAKSIITAAGKKIFGDIALQLEPLKPNADSTQYQAHGIMTYTKGTAKGFNSLNTSPSFGGIRFLLLINSDGQALSYQFSNIAFSRNMVHFTPLEQEEAPEAGKSTVFSNQQKNWEQIRAVYTGFLQALNAHIKPFAHKSFSALQEEHSLITYDTYKKIIIGMSYADVTALLQDEGRELSNSQQKVNGKTLSLQSVIWKSPKGDKHITVQFENGKVSGKSQSDL